MNQKRVLIIGKSPLVLGTLVASLEKLGHAAKATDNFVDDITTQFDMRQFDLVVFGGQVPPDKKAELIKTISALRPDTIFVQGLSGIPGLVLQQIQGAFAAEYQDAGHAPIFDPAKRAIQLSLTDAARVKVTAWWGTTFVPPNPGSDSRILVDEQMSAGEHAIPLPDDVPSKVVFASAQIGKAIYTFSLATE